MNILKYSNDFYNKIYNYIWRPKIRVLILGEDGVGKTSLFIRLMDVMAGNNLPRISFSIECGVYKNFDIKGCFQPAGKDSKVYQLFKYFYNSIDALIWVVDLTDMDSIIKSRDGINNIWVSDEKLQDKVLLIFANKIDLYNAINVESLKSMLQLETKNRKWKIIPISAFLDFGYDEGFEWLEKNYKTPLNEQFCNSNNNNNSV